MPWIRRKRMRCRICLGIGMGAFLWVQGAAGVLMAQTARPPVSDRPVTLMLQSDALTSRIEATPLPEAHPTLALRIPALSTSSSPGTDEAGTPGESRPLYKKGWFLAGLAVLVAGTAVLLASSGDDREHLPPPESLPDFPPPPDLRLSIGAGRSIH